MANNVGNYKRIAKNTMMLYIRMIFVTLVSLYTFRVLLAALGQEDYGLYNVVGGIVTMLSFLTHTLTSASQRFYSYYLGQRNFEQMSKIYSSTMLLYGAVIVIIVILAETLGLWFLNNHMTIPRDRIIAVNVVYQFSVLSFCWKVFTTAHQALIIAYERLSIYAYVSIVEVILQLAIVSFLTIYSNDRLILYAVLIFISQFLTNGFYIIYSKRVCKDVRYIRPRDLNLVKEITSYSGWTLFGMLSVVVRSSGINIVLNVFFGPIVNAARGIAFTVNSLVTTLTSNFYTAVRPQIVKNYSKQEMDACFKLIFRSTKFSYSLALIVVLPLYIFAPQVLLFWLGDFPENTILFMRLTLVNALIDSIANPLITFNQATGDIKKFQICVSLLLILNLPISIFAFWLGAKPFVAFVISIVLSTIANVIRIVIDQTEHGFPAVLYVKKVVVRLLLITLASALILPLINILNVNPTTIIQLFINALLICVWVAVCSFYLGFDKSERKFVLNIIINKIHR